MFYVKRSTPSGYNPEVKFNLNQVKETEKKFSHNTNKHNSDLYLYDGNLKSVLRGSSNKQNYSRLINQEPGRIIGDKNKENSVKKIKNYFKKNNEKQFEASLPSITENKTILTDYSPLKTDFNIKQETMDYRSKLKTSYASRQEVLNTVKHSHKRMFESDLFFERPVSIKEKISSPKKADGQQESDIFFKKAFDKVKEKTEEYTNYTNKKINLINNNSNSDWVPKVAKTSMFNHSSIPFSMLCSEVKSFSKTKEQILKETNSKHVHNRPKSLCEYFDLTRVYSPNENAEYMKVFKTSNKVFQKKSNLCTNFLNLHGFYNSICTKPFVKKII